MSIPDCYNLENVKDVYDLAEHIGASFPIANALKYLIRAGHKNPDTYTEDLQKALTSIQRELDKQKPKTQELPPEPPIGTLVENRYGDIWRHTQTNRWDHVRVENEWRTWEDLLQKGPLTELG